jgi:hypothetical protein
MVAMLSASLAAAQAAPAAAISAGDTAWVLMSSALVLLMTVGLAFFYGGLVRPKNSLNTMMMSVVALGVVGVQWVVVGYSLGFGPGTPWLGGLGWLFFRGVGVLPAPAYAATIPQQAHALFQGMFAIITPALISGAIVERMRFRAYVAFLVLWSTLVYDPLAHWVWGAGGWLATKGALGVGRGAPARAAARLPPRAARAAQRAARAPRRRPAVVRVVRLQRGLRARRQRHRLARLRQHQRGGGRGARDVGAAGQPAARQGDRGGRRHRRRGGPRRHHARGGLRRHFGRARHRPGPASTTRWTSSAATAWRASRARS